MEKVKVLPVYLILDSSASMHESNGGGWNDAFNFIPSFIECLERHPSIQEIARLSAFTFDESAKVILPLSKLEDVTKWYNDTKNAQIVPNGRQTKYSTAFELLYTQIQNDMRRLRADDFETYRPVAFLITDGHPVGESYEQIKSVFDKLVDVDNSFRNAPNLVCVGVGDATFDDLIPYASGRYKKESYTVGNENFVLIPVDGVTPAVALKQIIPSLINSIVNSLTNKSTNTDEDDVFGNTNDDLFAGMNIDDDD